jgi:predicted nucleic acid-binding protein
MIHLDTSVALAELLGEDRRPPARRWDEQLCLNRLLEYELWNRVHARKLTKRQHEEVAALVEQVSLVELSPTVLERALHPFLHRFGRWTKFTSRRSTSCTATDARCDSRATTIE